MPDTPLTTTSTNQWIQITQMVLQTITLLFMTWLGVRSNENHEKIDQINTRSEQIDTRTEEAAVKTETVKKSLDASSLGPLDKEIQLWSTWKYLESIADQTNKYEDRQKANDAKKLYDAQRNKR